MASENPKNSRPEVDGDEFESLDDLPPSKTVQATDGVEDPEYDTGESEFETTPIIELIDAEEFDNLDRLADTMPMQPRRENVDTPIIVSAAPVVSSELAGDGDEPTAVTASEDREEADAEGDAKFRGDVVPVPALNQISGSVSRSREARESKTKEPRAVEDIGAEIQTDERVESLKEEPRETKKSGNKDKAQKKSKAEKKAKAKSTEKEELATAALSEEPDSRPDRVPAASVSAEKNTNTRDKRDEDESDDDSENPISASMRDASAKEKPTVEDGGPVFLVDEAADQWIEEDLADASGPLGGVPVPRKPNPNGNSRRAKRKSGFWGKVAMLFFVCFLLLAVVAVGAWFSRSYLITKAENLAIQKLEEQGFPLSYESRSFEFPRGLVLSDVTIFEDPERTIPKLKIGNFGIDLDVWHLLSRRSVSNFEAVITLEDSTAIPFQDGEQICEITGINADLFATREHLIINRLRGTLNGLNFDVEGHLNLPEPDEDVAESGETPVDPDPAGDADAEGPILDFEFLKGAIEPIAFETKAGGENPVLRITVDLTPNLKLYADGSFSGTSFSWQGIPLDHAGVTFNYSENLNVIDIIDAQIGFGGGTITAKTQILIDQNKLENLALTSNADLIKLATYFDPTIEESLNGIEFLDSPRIEANGSYNMDDKMASNLTIDYQHWKGISVPVGENSVTISALNGQFEIRDGTIRTTPTSQFRAEVLGGDIEIKGDFRPEDEPVIFSGTLAASRIPVDKIAALAGQSTSELSGMLSVDFRGKVAPGDATKLNGSGDIQIDDGKLYSVPVIGAIQKLLATAIPIFGNRERSALKAHFDVMTGIFITNDLVIRSDGTKLKVGGKYNLSDHTTAFKAKANLDGPLGMATGLPAGMLLVVEGSGQISDPSIKLSGLPDGLSGILNSVTGEGEPESETAPEAPTETPGADGTTAPPAVPIPETLPTPEIPVVPEIVPIPEAGPSAAGPPAPAPVPNGE